MNNSSFFESLGYLSHPSRQCKLDAEMRSQSQNQFESRYADLSGIIPHPDNHNYYVLQEDADKWGVELRIYFIASDSIPQALESLVRSPRPSTLHNARINSNDFIWRLIEYGFVLNDMQDERTIRSRVPSDYFDDFERGFQLP